MKTIADSVSLVSFLGYSTVLHFGPNSEAFPLFRFDGVYDYRVTFLGALAIFVAETCSSFVARSACLWLYSVRRSCLAGLTAQVDVTAVGLDAFARYEGLLEAVLWTEAHVISDVLLFLCAEAKSVG